MRRISVSLLVALVFPALATGAARDTKLALVAYSTRREAYGQLIPAFQKTEAGSGPDRLRAADAPEDVQPIVDLVALSH
jgi:ABC-type sulfate transport system substrate-binding protein